MSENVNVRHAISYFPDPVEHSDNFYAFSLQKGSTYSNKHVNRLLQKCFGGVGISFHTFRKTFGRRVCNNNNKTEDALMYLSEMFNHSSLAITRRYSGVTRQEELDDIYMSL